MLRANASLARTPDSHLARTWRMRKIRSPIDLSAPARLIYALLGSAVYVGQLGCIT